MSDGEKLAAWLRDAAHEIENAHLTLDQYGAPRSMPAPDEAECTLAARIVLLMEAKEFGTTTWAALKAAADAKPDAPVSQIVDLIERLEKAGRKLGEHA